MYPILILEVVFWSYCLIYAVKFALSKRNNTKTPMSAKEAIRAQNKKPLDLGGVKYYRVEWNLQTGDVKEDVMD